MAHKFRVPDEIVSLIRGMHPVLKKRIKLAFNEILKDPYCGKALKEELDGLRSFPIKRFRIIYKVSSKKQISIDEAATPIQMYFSAFAIATAAIV